VHRALTAARRRLKAPLTQRGFFCGAPSAIRTHPRRDLFASHGWYGDVPRTNHYHSKRRQSAYFSGKFHASFLLFSFGV
jgi:hypothetical protein